MSDPHNKIKTLFMHPQTDPMMMAKVVALKEARRHLAIVEVYIEDIVRLLGFPTEFILKGAMIDDELGRLRIKLQHPSFPIKNEGENIVILPFVYHD